MMRGIRNRRSAALAILALANLLASRGALAAAGGNDAALENLMQGLRQVKTATAHFVEHKFLHILTQHIDTSGTLAYVAPDRLEKVTASPYPETMLLAGDTLSGAGRNGRHFSLNLRNHREVGALVEGMRATLAGDLANLRRYYRVEFLGTPEGWRLTLVPIDPAVRKKLEQICLLGSATMIAEIDYRQANGDHTEMVVTPDRR